MRRWTGWGVLVLVMMGSTASAASAAPEGGGAPDGFFKTIVGNAGVIGWLTIAMSVGGFTLIFYALFNLTRDKLVPEALTVELNNLMEEEQYEEALQLCAVDDSFLSKVMAAGLNNLGAGYEQMERSMQEAGEEQSIKLQQQISWLNLIANVAPMMGLLGTVSGMIEAFAVIEIEASPSPAKLAGGIKGALVTTLIGLCVAIPMLAAYFFFRARIDRVVIEAGLVIEELMARFRKEPA